MSKQPNIGGRAYANGVRLMNGNRTVKAYYDHENRLRLDVGRVKSNRYLSVFRGIPVLRGIASIIMALYMFLKESTRNPVKYWFVFVILLIEMVFWFLPRDGTAASVFLGIYYVFPVLLLIIFWSKIREVLKYHGAEHKAVNYYENDYQGEIDDYSRLHKRCGSNLIFYYLLLSFLTGFIRIPLNFLIRELLLLGLAYEFMKYTPDSLLFITTLFQRLVTREPEAKHLRAAGRALEVLTGKANTP